MNRGDGGNITQKTNEGNGVRLNYEYLIPKHNEGLIVTKDYKKSMDTIKKLSNMNYAVLLVGHAGVGKNQAISEVAHEMSRPVIRVNCSGDMRTSSLVGRITADAETGKITWQDGLIITAIRNGYWLILDEINSLDSDILFALHGLLDDGFITIANNSEVVKAHPDFRLFATMNPTSYYGVKTLNQALVDRFAVMEMDFDEGIDKKLLEQLEYPKEVQTSMFNLIGAVRVLYKNGDITQNFGHRTLSNVVKLSKEFELMDAVNMAYTNKLPEHERPSVKATFKDLTSMCSQIKKSNQTAKKTTPTPTTAGGQKPSQSDVDAILDMLSDAKNTTKTP